MSNLDVCASYTSTLLVVWQGGASGAGVLDALSSSPHTRRNTDLLPRAASRNGVSPHSDSASPLRTRHEYQGGCGTTDDGVRPNTHS